MSSYPFVQTSSVFNTNDYNVLDTGLTIETANMLYLSLSGGVISGNLNVLGNLDCGTLTVGGLSLNVVAITGVTPGICSASKALIVDSSRNINNINSLTSDTLIASTTITLGSTSISETEIGFLDGVSSAGTIVASKVITVNSSSQLNSNLQFATSRKILMNNSSSSAAYIDMGATASDRCISLFSDAVSYYGFGANSLALRSFSKDSFAWYTGATQSVIGTSIMTLNSAGLLTTTSLALSGTITGITGLSLTGVLTSSNTTVSTLNSNGALVLSGGIGISNTTDATSSTNGGTFTTAGGVAIAKTLYVGGNIAGNNLITTSLTTTSTSNSTGAVLLSGGIGINNTTDATSSTNGGTFTSAGGGAFAKSLYVGNTLTATTLVGTLSASSAAQTNITSVGTLASLNYTGLITGGTISAAARLLIYGSTSVTNSEGSANTFQINASTNGSFDKSSLYMGADATLNYGWIQSSRSGANSPITINGRGGTVAINTNSPNTSYTFHVNGLTLLSNTTGSTNSTTGALVLTGGICTNLTTDATSSTNGGTFTSAGGGAFAKSVYIGGNLAVIGTITLGGSLIDLGYITGVTAGTAVASKALVLDASKNISTINSVTSNYLVCNTAFNSPAATANLSTLNLNGIATNYGVSSIKGNATLNSPSFATTNSIIYMESSNATPITAEFGLSSGTGATSSNGLKLGTLSNNDFSLFTNSGIRMVIKANAAIGLGSNASSADKSLCILDGINGVTTTSFRIGNTLTTNNCMSMEWICSGGSGSGGNALHFNPYGTNDALVINCNGYIGIGGNGLYPLDIFSYKTSTVEAPYALSESTTASYVASPNISGQNISLNCLHSALFLEKVFISSDRRLKKNIAPINIKVARQFLNVQPVVYHKREQADNDMLNFGYIAQDIMKNSIGELLCHVDNDNMKIEEDGDIPGIQFNVQYDKVAPLLHVIVKEHDNIIEKLKSKINNLEEILKRILYLDDPDSIVSD